MFVIPKTILSFDNRWLERIKFKDHTDYDLQGNCYAIAIKSESGSVYDFYRSDPLENPDNFKYTQLYHTFKEVKQLSDYFKFLERSRIRIHKSDPGHKISLHTDDNNINAKNKTDYKLRMITALNQDDDFIYTYEYKGKLSEINLCQGQSIIFDPDTVRHGLINTSNTKARYALVQIFNAYPINKELHRFINNDETVTL